MKAETIDKPLTKAERKQRTLEHFDTWIDHWQNVASELANQMMNPSSESFIELNTKRNNAIAKVNELKAQKRNYETGKPMLGNQVHFPTHKVPQMRK